jgi:hypothetical protein
LYWLPLAVLLGLHGMRGVVGLIDELLPATRRGPRDPSVDISIREVEDHDDVLGGIAAVIIHGL